MPKMRCLHCGRWVLVDHSQNINQARCICGTFVLTSYEKETVPAPKLTLNHFKPKRVIDLSPAIKLKTKQSAKAAVQNNYDLEECAA